MISVDSCCGAICDCYLQIAGSTCALSSAVAPVHNSEPQIGHRCRVANKSKTARRATGRPQRMSETPRIPDADRRRLIESIEQHGAATRSAVAVAVEPLVWQRPWFMRQRTRHRRSNRSQKTTQHLPLIRPRQNNNKMVRPIQSMMIRLDFLPPPTAVVQL